MLLHLLINWELHHLHVVWTYFKSLSTVHYEFELRDSNSSAKGHGLTHLGKLNWSFFLDQSLIYHLLCKHIKQHLVENWNYVQILIKCQEKVGHCLSLNTLKKKKQNIMFYTMIVYMVHMYMLWFKFFFGLKLFKPV